MGPGKVLENIVIFIFNNVLYSIAWNNKYSCDSPFCAFQEIFRRKEISQNWCSNISRKNVSKSVSLFGPFKLL